MFVCWSQSSGLWWLWALWKDYFMFPDWKLTLATLQRLSQVICLSLAGWRHASRWSQRQVFARCLPRRDAKKRTSLEASRQHLLESQKNMTAPLSRKTCTSGRKSSRAQLFSHARGCSLSSPRTFSSTNFSRTSSATGAALSSSDMPHQKLGDRHPPGSCVGKK